MKMCSQSSGHNPSHLHATTVGGVLYNLIRHPYELLIRRWNWKSALMSSLIRGIIFFCTNLVAGLRAAIGAALVEFIYRALTAGVYGSMTQAFRHARPAWAAALTAMVLLPIVSHIFEFLIHWARGTPELLGSILASALFTVLSTLFNLYAMRKGALVVGPQNDSLAQDMRRMPGIVVGFVAVGVKGVYRLCKSLLVTWKPSPPGAAAPRNPRDSRERTYAD
ncbi:MAG TPA: hypothetical protein VNO70_21525 [Blastocatellia bacterium]|nr:hypothetical protein [Blastocatellia bacterium]